MSVRRVKRFRKVICSSIRGLGKGTCFCVSLLDPICVLGLGFDWICYGYGSCFVRTMLFC